MRDNDGRIKKRILIPLALGLLLLLGVSFFSLYWQQQWQLQQQIRASLTSVERLFPGLLAEEAKFLEGQIEFLKIDFILQQAYLNRDRQAFVQHAQPIFENMHTKSGVTHFYVTTLDGVRFVRVHSPTVYGDNANNFTTAQAARQDSPAYGIELGKFGTFTLRVVYPWYIDGELRGYIELGEEVEQITPKLKEILNVEVFFIIDKTYLDQTSWQQGVQLMGLTGDWDQYADFVIIDRTLPQPPANLEPYLKRSHADHYDTLFYTSVSERSYLAGFVRLFDASGRDVGDILVLNDVTVAEARLEGILAALMSLAVLIGGGLFGFFYLYTNRIEQQLVSRRQELTSEITERTRAEEKLQHTMRQIERSKRLLWAVIDATPDWIFARDKSFRYILVNHSFAQVFNRTPQEMINQTEAELGISFEQIFDNPSNRLPTFRADDEAVLTGQTIRRSYDLGAGGDGIRRVFDTYKLPLYDRQGDIFAVLSISRDITKRKQMEAELRQHRTHLEELVADRTKRLELITTLSGHLNAIRDLHNLLAELVNRTRETFDYYHVHVYLVEAESDDLVMIAGSGDVGRQLKQRGHRLQRGQGIVGNVASTNHYFLSNNVDSVAHFFRNPLLPDTQSELAVPLRKGNQVIGVLDIQDRRQHRFTSEDVSIMQTIADQTTIAVDNARLLAERQNTILKLQEADRIKSQFITMVSHELRTPLQAINGFAELLLLELGGPLPEFIQKDVQLIHKNGLHLLDLINDILDISQIDSGELQLNPEPLEPQEIVDEVLTAAKIWLKDKPVKFIIDIADDMPPIYADPTRLKQILLNLMSNAIKFTNEGAVTVSVNRHSSSDNMAQFAVSDTGSGIPADKRQEIFERFRQVDMSDSRPHGGTGLGLAICKHLVEMHGGEIGVQSEKGVGSEFYFTIPFVTALNL